MRPQIHLEAIIDFKEQKGLYVILAKLNIIDINWYGHKIQDWMRK